MAKRLVFSWMKFIKFIFILFIIIFVGYLVISFKPSDANNMKNNSGINEPSQKKAETPNKISNNIDDKKILKEQAQSIKSKENSNNEIILKTNKTKVGKNITPIVEENLTTNNNNIEIAVNERIIGNDKFICDKWDYSRNQCIGTWNKV